MGVIPVWSLFSAKQFLVDANQFSCFELHNLHRFTDLHIFSSWLWMRWIHFKYKIFWTEAKSLDELICRSYIERIWTQQKQKQSTNWNYRQRTIWIAQTHNQCKTSSVYIFLVLLSTFRMGTEKKTAKATTTTTRLRMDFQCLWPEFETEIFHTGKHAVPITLRTSISIRGFCAFGFDTFR